ncbi:translation initiation factor eIF 4e-like domain-containing protein [Blastocladiella britannica]|nr:translation initiation factor eIF 4e-like domain-containing protein [Blastocladiella britannica]
MSAALRSTTSTTTTTLDTRSASPAPYGTESDDDTGAAVPILPLAAAWTVYYSHRSAHQRIANYEDAIKNIAEFATVQEFWRAYAYLKRPADMQAISDYHIFRSGIRPMWEDSHNVKGGKWMIRLRKGIAGRFWEDLLLAMIGNQFHDPINGVVLSIRSSEDILSIWMPEAAGSSSSPTSSSSSSDPAAVSEAKAAAAAAGVLSRTRDALKGLLHLPDNATLEYKDHNDSLRDKSSFRNTDVLR